MKDIFQKAAKALGDILFIIPSLQLDDAQKKYLEAHDYKATRCEMPIMMAPYTVTTPTLTYDYISKQDGTELSNREYREIVKKLATIAPPAQAPQHKL
jgi:hypothetical protein|tara:strand:- start:110368 stop:110661 length:294 start_codon:yes stop_codon:yes gene_type:complete